MYGIAAVGARQVGALADVLVQMPELETLLLGGNDLDDEAFKLLGSQVKASPVPTWVSIYTWTARHCRWLPTHNNLCHDCGLMSIWLQECSCLNFMHPGSLAVDHWLWPCIKTSLLGVYLRLFL